MPARVPYTPGEFAALAAWHKDAAVIEKAMSGKTGDHSSNRDDGGGSKKDRDKSKSKGKDKGAGGKGGAPAAAADKA